MILKYPNGFPFELYFVTGDLLNTLSSQAIPFGDLKKIHAYHEKLTFTEIANFIAVQRAAAQLFGVDLAEPFFGEGYNGGMVAEAFNGIDSKAITEHLREAGRFHSSVIGQVIVVGVNADQCKATASWDKLQAKNLSTAVLETIYARVGYLQAHFGSVVKPSLGTLSMAEVYKFVHLQNP